MKPLHRLLLGLSITTATLTGTLATAGTAAADTPSTITTPAAAPADDRSGRTPTLPDAVPLDTWWG